MKLFVTGGAGFAGSWLVPRLARAGHEVTVGVHQADTPPAGGRSVAFDLTDHASVARALAPGFDAVVHLAAITWSSDAFEDPGRAWSVNAAGTARVAAVLGEQRRAGAHPRLLVVSSADVYGPSEARHLRRESDPVSPCAPYGASKAGAELASAAVRRQDGLDVVFARPFAHVGKGQKPWFVVPALAKRVLEAKRSGQRRIAVGNLDVVRDFSHVADVVEAYCRLLERGRAGETYNVASGRGMGLREIIDRLAALAGVEVTPEIDTALVRPVDIPHLVGDASKLRRETGWEATHSLDQALEEVLHAQAN